MSNLTKKLQLIKQNIFLACQKAKRDPQSVKLLAVTKASDIKTIKQAYDLGLRDFGENKLQNALAKIEYFQDKTLNWHFIGNVQSNKLKKILTNFNCLHSLASKKNIQLADKLANELDLNIKGFLEVNIAGELSKHGFCEAELPEVIDLCKGLKKLKIIGLMTMAPYEKEAEKTRPVFKKLKKIADYYDLKELSMGMSNDYQMAIEEGSTIIRIGSFLFS